MTCMECGWRLLIRVDIELKSTNLAGIIAWSSTPPTETCPGLIGVVRDKHGGDGIEDRLIVIGFIGDIFLIIRVP